MVAVIHYSRSIRAVLNYNEKKVEHQVAGCIDAVNFPISAADMSFQQKLACFQKRNTLNEAAEINTVHISLNFAPTEVFTQQQLSEIARDYMERIGFGTQPYLVYQHRDSGHPHIHIAATAIKPDGKVLPLHNLGKYKSEPARKAIEEHYNLVRAEDHKRGVFQIKAVDPAVVRYGQSDTRRAIYNVLAAVLKPYKYTSLAELNAVLKLYNVAAEPGAEGSRTASHKGLYYRVLDANGRPVGAPVKASLFPAWLPEKPTLKVIEGRFAVNDAMRQPDKKRIKSTIDFALAAANKPSFAGLVSQLKRSGIATVTRENNEGRIYGITFIDHKTKAIFNGSDLGKQYTANAILSRCAPIPERRSQGLNIPASRLATDKNPPRQPNANSTASAGLSQLQPVTDSSGAGGLLDELMRPEYGADHVPYELRRLKKRKKRKQSRRL